MPKDNTIETLKQRIRDTGVHESVSVAWQKTGFLFEKQIKRTPSSPLLVQIQSVENIKSVGFLH